MNPEQIYQELIDLAEKLHITVTEERLAKNVVTVKSGACVVNNQKRFILDRQLSLQKKIDILAEYLSGLPHDDVYVVPVVRDLIAKYRSIQLKFT